MDSEAEEEVTQDMAIEDISASEAGFLSRQALWLESRFGRVAGVMQETQGRLHHFQDVQETCNRKFDSFDIGTNQALGLIMNRISETENLLRHLGLQVATLAPSMASQSDQMKSDY